MPPAANESQGLKIAVAAFVSLTVILAVTTYFMYSNYSQASSQLTKAQEDLRTESKAKGIALEQYQQLRDALGYTTLEDHEAVKAAMKKDRDDILRQVNDIAREVSDAVGKAQQGGEADPKFEELRSTAQGLVAAYAQEPSSYKDSMIRITNLLGNLSALSTAFATNDVALRQSLTSANAVNSERLAQQSGGFEKSKQDLESTHVQHEKERAQLMAAVDDAQTRLRQLSTDLAQLQSRYDRDTEKLNRDLTLARAIGREARDQMAKTDVVLDRADGKVLGVDFSTNTVRLDLTKGQGAKPQMKFSIFDRNSPGLPTESPKARVELISVSDRDSVARIETGSTFPLRPIGAGDLVYSAAWSPNDPQKFALIGRIDINRDGKDDRGDLIRMIEAAGGVVEFDLPPPDADATPGRRAVTRAYLDRGEPAPAPQGRAMGELTSRFAYYVIDERGAFARERKVDEVPTADDAAFLEAVSEATRLARENGIRPLPIDRLLAYMGYSGYGKIPVRGRTEYTNPAAIKALTQPKGNTGVGTGAGAAASPEAGAIDPDDDF